LYHQSAYFAALSDRGTPRVILGVTGGMGAGKSAFTRFLAACGDSLGDSLVVDADATAHEVIGRAELHRGIIECFGVDLVDASGHLNRRLLGARAFVDRESLEKLYALIKDDLERALLQELDGAVARAGKGLVVFDAPLIFEWGIEHWVDAVAVVFAQQECCLRRVAERSGLEKREVEHRMALQMPVADKVARADYAIDNNGSLEALQWQAEKLWAELNGEVWTR